jgi:hypothetical protein
MASLLAVLAIGIAIGAAIVVAIGVAGIVIYKLL